MGQVEDGSFDFVLISDRCNKCILSLWEGGQSCMGPLVHGLQTLHMAILTILFN